MRTYFVTGASGVVGSALIPALLRDHDTHIHLLLRAASADELAGRLDALLRFWRIAPGDEASRRRLDAWAGDVSEPRLGLDETAHRALVAACTHIVHAAGDVRMNLPIDEARRCAVGSAQNIVQLAHDCDRLEKIEFVSTVGVGGKGDGPLPEEWILRPRVFHNSYEQAKAEAEDFIRGEVQRGLPLTVHRPSMVVGDSRSGATIHFQVFYHLCDFLSGRRTLGLFPDLGDSGLDLIPVDFVAQAIAWSSRQAHTAGNILHLCAGPDGAIRIADLRIKVRAAYHDAGLRLPPVTTLSPRLFRSMLKGVRPFLNGRSRRAINTLPIFLDYLADRQSFSNGRTMTLLQSAGLRLPLVDSYFDAVMAAYLSKRGTLAT
jgi:thioester reductase-like protein